MHRSLWRWAACASPLCREVQIMARSVLVGALFLLSLTRRSLGSWPNHISISPRLDSLTKQINSQVSKSDRGNIFRLFSLPLRAWWSCVARRCPFSLRFTAVRTRRRALGIKCLGFLIRSAMSGNEFNI